MALAHQALGVEDLEIVVITLLRVDRLVVDSEDNNLHSTKVLGVDLELHQLLLPLALAALLL